MKPEYPYRQCLNCESLTDCPEPEISLDGFGSPLPPEDCPKKDERNQDRIKN